MKKHFVYVGSVLGSLLADICQAAERFEILPDLPDPLSQSANATTITKNAAAASTSVGHEPTVLSVVLSLAFVILLIYATGIIYAKLNRAGFNAMRKQKGNDLLRSQATVISTTQLGNNKSLHVIELDGKRMLIGASNAAIQLIKDLGTFSENSDNEEYSSIEIPSIKIPKFEIPKIEIPSLKLSKIVTKIHNNNDINTEEDNTSNPFKNGDSFENNVDINSFYPESDNITASAPKEDTAHKVDPDEFALYKKYIN